MRSRIVIFGFSCVAMLQPALAPAQEAIPYNALIDESIQEYVLEALGRYEGVDHYVQKKSDETIANFWTMEPGEGDVITSAPFEGKCSSLADCSVYKVERLDDGTLRPRLLGYLEVAELAGISPGSGALQDMGTGMLLFQQVYNVETTGQTDPDGKLQNLAEYFQASENQRANKKKDVGEDQPWMDPNALVGAGGLMMWETSKAVANAEESLRIGADTARKEKDQEVSLLRQLEPRGTEEFGGVAANRYEVPDPVMPMPEVDGQQVTWNKANFWIDPEQQVALGHRLEGTIEADGESREFYLQVTYADFRNPAGCGDMLEPYRQTMEMGGMLDDEQMAQMEEARRQLEEFDRQLAAMPANQRQMMESMMGNQLETIRNMANSGAFSYTIETEEILCNPDLKALFSVPGMEGGIIPSADNLLVQIQTDLETLGYAPGNTNGILDTMTQVAISQFQAEAGLEVTGEPSQQLANALRTAVAGQ